MSVAAVTALVILVLGLARPVGAAVAVDPGTRPDSSEREVIDSVRLDEDVMSVLRFRPGAVLGASFRPGNDTWLVHARIVSSDRNLLEYTVRDGSLEVTRRWMLPFQDYPPATSRERAITVARHSNVAARKARPYGGLERMSVSTHFVNGRWEVSFREGRVDRVQVDIEDATGSVIGVWTGYQIPWEMARGDRYAFGQVFNVWYVFWLSFVLFAIVMLELGSWQRLRSWYSVDVLVLLSFGISHELFNRGHIEWSVPLAFPPLVYLFMRMSHVYLKGVRPLPDARPPASRRRWLRWHMPTWLLVLVAVFAAGTRYGIDGWGTGVVDVGYAGVSGAATLLDGRSPYGNAAPDNEHGDTYGPLNYVAYLPSTLIWNGHDTPEWDEGLPAAHAVSIASDLLCVVALVLVGWRWISRRGAALLAAGWLTYPYTGWALCSNVNDLLVAALLLLAFAALPRAWLRGALVGCAAMVKFVPILALAPIAHAGTLRRGRQVLATISAASLVILACLAWVASYPHGWSSFTHATFGFQVSRSSPFSPWGMYDLRWLQRIAQAALLVAVAAATWLPPRRDFRQVAAGMAATMLGVELVLQHWFYLYIPWFAGFVLIVLVAARESRTLPPQRAASDADHDGPDSESVYSPA